ncbi:MAG: hypothetical protein SGARI_001405, partial [Bacillariaceae sp.]
LCPKLCMASSCTFMVFSAHLTGGVLTGVANAVEVLPSPSVNSLLFLSQGDTSASAEFILSLLGFPCGVMGVLSDNTNEEVATASSMDFFILLALSLDDFFLRKGGRSPFRLLTTSVRNESADFVLAGGFLRCDGDTGEGSADLDFVDCHGRT